MSLNPKQQLDWYWSRKAEIEYNKFMEGLKPKKLPYDRITLSLLRKFSLSKTTRDKIEHLSGRKSLKTLICHQNLCTLFIEI
ncbi:MAG: hypothetical protein HVN34_02990 [Methanobacteriaceae archaeon]|jgi:hypothetical protein|nr:hypothetical protein [Methanobacteriaceae archaeon]